MRGITKSEFEEYVKEQKSGEHNMLSIKARKNTSLSKTKWITIISNYSSLHKKYNKGDE
tara:strand:- start:27329 stop:27505 length:177 start_codon:yes stop_codon:yes gene_type:complete